MSTIRQHYAALAILIGLATLGSVPASPAQAASSYRIEQLYSNLDGTVQYIRLRESAGRDGEQAIGGLTITVTGGGVTKSFTIPRDLWWTTTAGTPVQISTEVTPDVCCSPTAYGDWTYAPLAGTGTAYALRSISDYPTLPPRFLPVGGGTIRIEGVDVVDFPALPTNGLHALDRDGHAVRAEVRSFVRSINPFGITFPDPQVHEVIPTTVIAREYYHAGLDHYFVTANATEIDALDSGALSGWAFQGFAFGVATYAGTVDVSEIAAQTLHYAGAPVCRYYLPPPLGDTHFFSASAAECASVAATLPGVILESASAFVVDAADPATGACPVTATGETYEVYRLWNGRAAANHRYTQSLEVRAAMIASGWISEGYGPLGVAFCSTTYSYYWEW